MQLIKGIKIVVFHKKEDLMVSLSAKLLSGAPAEGV
jgi:hypothetical protein